MRKINYLHAGRVFSGDLQDGKVIPRSGSHHADMLVSEAQLLPAVIKPGKIICVGMNYPPPLTKSGWSPPKFPVLFHKVASSLIGVGSAIILPKISNQVLYEGELAVVIGSKGKNIPVENAIDFVAGYTIANDVGAADIEKRSSQWTSGKMFDTFCPLGPALVTPDEIPNPGNLTIKTSLNGQIVQLGNTREMFFNIPFLISYISQLTTLEEDDIILTGSPKRAGQHPDPRTPLKPGDKIEIEIESLGLLENSAIAEEL